MTLWTVACQTLLYIGLPWQEYWTGLPPPSPGDLPDTGLEHMSPVLCLLHWQVGSFPLSHLGNL